jgi:hypothetical protein
LCLGVVLGGIGLILTHGDLSAIFENDVRTEKFVDETQTVNSLKISAAADDIELYKSEDEFLHIDYYDSKLRPFDYSYTDGRAELKQKSTVKSWFNFGSFESKTMKIYVPESLTSELNIDVSSGTITNSGLIIDVQTLKLNASSGDIVLGI